MGSVESNGIIDCHDEGSGCDESEVATIAALACSN